MIYPHRNVSLSLPPCGVFYWSHLYVKIYNIRLVCVIVCLRTIRVLPTCQFQLSASTEEALFAPAAGEKHSKSPVAL